MCSKLVRTPVNGTKPAEQGQACCHHSWSWSRHWCHLERQCHFRGMAIKKGHQLKLAAATMNPKDWHLVWWERNGFVNKLHFNVLEFVPP
jgi:hypothetical protein